MTGTNERPLPGGAWQALFPRALILIDDLALVVEREAQQLVPARPFLLSHREAFLDQVRHPHPSLRAAFDAIAALEYRPSFDDCVKTASEFLEGL